MSLPNVVDRWRPETAAGGFTRDDEAVAFYSRVNALLDPGMTVLDLGAGRGSRYDSGTAPFVRDLCTLQGKVKRMIGIDLDPAVLEHPRLDEAHVIEPDAPYPLDDGSIDLIVCEYVVEHVEDPAGFAREIDRILKPGGWFCALTPNKYGYVGLGNTIVPEKVKSRLMRSIWPERPEDDVFPTFYRLNTLGQFRQAFPAAQWEHHGYTSSVTPKYHGNRSTLFAAVSAFQAVAPAMFQTNLLVFSQKRASSAA